MGLQRFPFGNFQGGVNLQDSPQEIESFEAQAARNMRMGIGKIFQREGKTRFDTGGLGSSRRVGHMRAWYGGSGSRVLLTCDDGSVWTMTGAGVLANAIAGGSNSLWDFEPGQDSVGNDRLWMMDGVTLPKKMDPAGTVTNWANTPPVGTMMVMWENRMCIAGVAATPQRLFFSDIGNPESPGAAYGSNWVDIKTTDDDLDPITWIQVCGPYLLVFKRQSVWVVVESTGFTTHRLGNPGCESRFQSVEVGGKCYFFSRNGLWSTDGSGPPSFEGRNVESFVTEHLTYDHLDKVRVYATRNRHVFASIPTGGAVQNNVCLEYPLPLYFRVPGTRRLFRTPWVIHNMSVSSMCSFRPTGAEDFLFGGASDANKIHRLFDGLNDDGAAIDAYWQTGWVKVVSEEPFERVRRINQMMSGSCDVDLFQDFNTVPKFSKRVSSPDRSDPLWEGGPWESGPWESPSPVKLTRVRPEKRGRYHSVMYRNNVLNKTFTIYTAEMAVRGGKEH